MAYYNITFNGVVFSVETDDLELGKVYPIPEAEDEVAEYFYQMSDDCFSICFRFKEEKWEGLKNATRKKPK